MKGIDKQRPGQMNRSKGTADARRCTQIEGKKMNRGIGTTDGHRFIQIEENKMNKYNRLYKITGACLLLLILTIPQTLARFTIGELNDLPDCENNIEGGE